MKIVSLLVFPILVWMMPFPSAGASAQVLERAVRHFDEGNVRYGAGDYRSAIAAYERAADEGYVSGALFFNMGNAYYRLDEIGQAIRHYEKAAELMPGRSEVDHNLTIARERTVDRFSRLPTPFWQTWWDAVVSAVGDMRLLAVGLLFYFAATAALAIRIRRGPTPWRRRVLTASLVLASVFIVAGFTASLSGSKAGRAVVLIDEVALLNAPTGSRSDLEIHEGLVVDVVLTRDGWAEVRLPNGASGWIRTESLGPI